MLKSNRSVVLPFSPSSTHPTHAYHIKPRIFQTHQRLILTKSSNNDNNIPATNTSTDQQQRLYSNLDPQTLQHQPGSVWGASALVAGTAVGAGILAIPAVTADAGFAASSVALTGCCLFSILTGFLVAEVTINTLCELGGGRGVSIGSMAKRTLGDNGSIAVSLCYAFLHYTLLVAYIAKGGETLAQATGAPLIPSELGFTALVGGLCYLSSATVLDGVNSVLVAGVIASFLALLVSSASGLDPSLLAKANWEAVPDALPVISLAFVFQNVCFIFKIATLHCIFYNMKIQILKLN